MLFTMSNEASSYNFNDAHPARQYNADDLSQGDIEWNVNEDDEIARSLKKYKSVNTKGARKQRFISGARVLYINNIFLYGRLKNYVPICEVVNVIECTAACHRTGCLNLIPGL